MLERLDAMESELGALTEALRTGANRLNADLQLLEGNLTDVGEAVAPGRGLSGKARRGGAEPRSRARGRPEPSQRPPQPSQRPPPAEPEAPADKSPVYEVTAEPVADGSRSTRVPPPRPRSRSTASRSRRTPRPTVGPAPRRPSRPPPPVARTTPRALG